MNMAVQFSFLIHVELFLILITIKEHWKYLNTVDVL